jgi:hypothetical protein
MKISEDSSHWTAILISLQPAWNWLLPFSFVSSGYRIRPRSLVDIYATGLMPMQYRFLSLLYSGHPVQSFSQFLAQIANILFNVSKIHNQPTSESRQFSRYSDGLQDGRSEFECRQR